MDDDQDAGAGELDEMLAGLEQSGADGEGDKPEADADAGTKDTEGDADADREDGEGEKDKPEDEDKGEDEPQRKKPSGAERARRRIERLEAEIAELRERRPAAAGDDAALAAAVEAEIGPPPKETDYANYLEFSEARAAYKAAELIVRRDAKREAGKAESLQQARVAELVEEAEDRLDELEKAVPGSRAKIEAGKAQPAPHVARLVLESDKSALLQLHLTDHPDKIASLNRLPPVEAARAIGRIEARLSLPKPRTETKAQPPVRSVKGGAGPSSPSAEIDAWIARKYGR